MPWSSTEYGPLQTYSDKNGNSYTSPFRWNTRTSVSSVQPRKRPVVLTLPTSQTTYYRSESVMKNAMVNVPQIGMRPLQGYAPLAASFNEAAVSAEVASAEAQAAARLRAALKDTTWNAAQTFAELGKTWAFVADAARDLMHAYRAARRGDVFQLADLYHRYDYRGQRKKPPYVRVANRWLQWRYAVQPIAWDFQDMLNEWYRSPTQAAVTQTRGYGKESVNRLVASGPSYIPVGVPYWVSRAGNVRCRYTVVHKVQPSITDWKRLGLINVPALLWELTPASFMFDWVLPVGNYLNGLDAAVGIEVSYTLKATKHDWGEECGLQGGFQTASGRSYHRLPTSLPNQPLPRWSSKPWKDGHVKKRLADVLALLTQLKHQEIRTGLKKFRGD